MVAHRGKDVRRPADPLVEGDAVDHLTLPIDRVLLGHAQQRVTESTLGALEGRHPRSIAAYTATLSTATSAS